jgi:hypothetical protein
MIKTHIGEITSVYPCVYLHVSAQHSLYRFDEIMDVVPLKGTPSKYFFNKVSFPFGENRGLK